VNSSSDTSVPADTSLDPGDWDIPADGSFDVDVTELDPTDLDDMTESNINDLEFGDIGGLGDDGDGGGDNAAESNPSDDLDGQVGSSGSTPALTSDGDIDDPKVGDELTAPSICAGGEVIFYRIDPTVAGGRVIAAEATATYTMIINDVDKSVYAEVRCPDPSSPDGYGEPIRTAATPIISPECGGIEGIEYNGTVPPPGNTIGAPLTLADGAITYRTYNFQTSTCSGTIDPPTTTAGSSVTLQNVKGIELVSVPGTCGGTKQLLWRVTYATNVVQDRNIIQTGDVRGFASLEASVTVTWDDPSAVPYCP
jgi:hypothetical protein